MGAFVLFRKNSGNIDSDAVRSVYTKKGFSDNVLQFDLINFNLLYYSKINVKEPQIYKNGNDLLLGTGTFIYKRKWGADALNEIFQAIRQKTLDLKNISGDYFLIHVERGSSIHFYPSPSYCYNVFYDCNEDIFSSSFLAVIEGLKSKIGINVQAAAELLLTGNLSGPDTLINEIYRIENCTVLRSSEYTLHSTKTEINAEIQKDNTSKSFVSAIDFQLQNLNSYFLEVGSFISSKGMCLGLTGGLDSRLLLACLVRNKTLPFIYSTWHKEKTDEFSNACKVAERIGMTLNTLKYIEWRDMDPAAFKDLIDRNFWFNDGLIRTHQLWSEEIKSKCYLERLVGMNLINSTGIGGEQYRNNERIKISGCYDPDTWIKYEVLLKNTSNPFKNRKDGNAIGEYLKSKFKKILDIDTEENIDYLTIKRYFNEVYNPSNRATRNNIENQLIYFLSPFTDFTLSRNAYAAIPWLGADFDFEKEMINRLNTPMAEVMTDYGFRPNDDVILTQRVASLLKANFGSRIFRDLYRMKARRSTYLSDIEKRFPGLDKYRGKVSELQIPLNIVRIAQSPFLSPLILELGYFIEKYESKLK